MTRGDFFVIIYHMSKKNFSEKSKSPRYAFSVAYCGIACALSSLIMFAAIIPSMTYIMPALAGIVIWSVKGQVDSIHGSGGKWAYTTYAATALLSMLLVPEMESKTLFILFLGYFPLLRETIHKLFSGKSFVSFCRRMAIKLVLFNIAAVSSYQIIIRVFGVSDILNDLSGFGHNAVYVFWGLGNVAFFCYDFALNYIIYAYDAWVKPALNKKLR